MNIILYHLDQGNQVSFARFNDGELGSIMGDLNKTSRGDQIVDVDLKSKLLEAIRFESKHYYKGYPCIQCFPKYRKEFDRLVKAYPYQLPLSHFTNNTGKWVKSELLSVLSGKETCYIGSNDCNTEWLNANFSDYSLWPNRNTSMHTKEILEYVQKSDKKIFIFAIGAISRYLVMQIHKMGKSGLDLGSMFDPETKGNILKCHNWIHKYQNSQKYCKECNF